MYSTVRQGKFLTLAKHAVEGMNCERPPIQIHEVVEVIEEPDHDDGNQAIKWMGHRTLILYYSLYEDEIHVRSVSATKGRLAP